MAKIRNVDGMNLTRSQYFWRTQRECWRRMVTPYIMYLFMSMLLLATQTISSASLVWLKILLGIVCILIGAFFNGHLAYNTGSMHYDAYLTGCIHRKRIEEGIASGGDHRPEREYAPWKGFYIGFLVGIPVILFAGLSCIPTLLQFGVVQFLLIMFAGFAIVPVSWAYGVNGLNGAPTGAYAWAMLMVLLPIIVTGVFYIVGAMVEKRKKQVIEERQEAAEQAKNAPKEYHEQTEEQKRKTMQSKKKKK